MYDIASPYGAGAAEISGAALPCKPLCSSSAGDDHPQYAEAVLHHAKTRGEEGLGQRHPHRAAFAQGAEQPLRFGVVRRIERKPEALEIRRSQTFAVGCEDGRVTDLKSDVHDLVLVGIRIRIVGTWWHVLEAHQMHDLCVDRRAIEINRLFAAAVEEQIGLNRHCRLSSMFSAPACGGLEGVKRKVRWTFRSPETRSAMRDGQSEA